MHYSVPVRVIESRKNPGAYFQSPFREQAATTGNYLPQGHPVDIFHNNVGNHNRRFSVVTLWGKRVLPAVVDRNNIWVIKGGCALRLPSETILEGRVFG